MKPIVRHIIGLSALAVMAVAFVAVLTVTRIKRSDVVCSGLRIEVTDSSRLGFVSVNDVREYLKGYGAYIGQRTDSVNLEKIEGILDHKSAILKSEAYMTGDGLLNVTITQREPVVRFQKGAIGFYADDAGYVFPLQRGYVSDVPIVDGNIPLAVGEGFKGEPESPEEKLWLERMIGMARYMKKSKLWEENIAQITVLQDGGLMMVPRLGRERFLFGAPVQVEKKFRKMREYYEYIAPSKADGYYTTVNLKYDGQIICRQ